MRGFRASRRRLSFGAALGAAVAVTATVLVAASSAAGPTSHPISVDPQVSGPQKLQPDAVVFGCQSRPIDGSAGPRCYQPSQMQTAYGLTPLLGHGINGHGKTIVIIDAFHDPFMADDLKIFDQVMGLPDPPHFKQFAPADSPPPFDPNDDNQVGWAIETALDVEWAHAMAPGANIVLAEARSNEDTDILNTTAAVVNHRLGDVISQSFGENETCVDHSVLTQEEALFKKAVNQGMTLFASSGDSGAAQFNCDGTAAALAASSPASDPNVTGVGGTTLNARLPGRASTSARRRGRSSSSAATRPPSTSTTSTAVAAVSARSTAAPATSQVTSRGTSEAFRMSRTTQESTAACCSIAASAT